jgi:oxygen-independent coproporphyrinogen-3 oxidase
MNDRFSVYIHIPFCIKKCAYCDFVSYENAAGMQPAYFAALKREIEQKQHLLNRRVDTVYIGGGTPSFVNAAYIAQMLSALRRYARFRRTAKYPLK